MNKNQKIAIGCGGLGCLGLVLALVLGGFVYYYYSRRAPARTYNFNSSPNSNRNSNANDSTNRSSANSSNDTSSYSDDEKHRLFQAAGVTKDQELTLRVLKKIGYFKADGTPTDDYPQFIKDHFTWALSNVEFINSINTPEKARAYVDEHL